MRWFRYRPLDSGAGSSVWRRHSAVAVSYAGTYSFVEGCERVSATVLTLSEEICLDDLVNQQAHTLTLPQPYGSGHSCAVSYSSMIADLAARNLPLAIRLAIHLSSAWGLRMIQAEAGLAVDGCF